MNSQKVDMTIKQEQEQHLEDEKHLWTLGSLEIILMKIGNQDVSTVMYMNIWQKNAENQKRIKK